MVIPLFAIMLSSMYHDVFKWLLTLTVTQSENGRVTRTSANDTKVKIIAQRPGPSGSAAKKMRTRSLLRGERVFPLDIFLGMCVGD